MLRPLLASLKSANSSWLHQAREHGRPLFCRSHCVAVSLTRRRPRGSQRRRTATSLRPGLYMGKLTLIIGARRGSGGSAARRADGRRRLCWRTDRRPAQARRKWHISGARSVPRGRTTGPTCLPGRQAGGGGCSSGGGGCGSVRCKKRALDKGRRTFCAPTSSWLLAACGRGRRARGGRDGWQGILGGASRDWLADPTTDQ